MKQQVWQILYPDWPVQKSALTPGYSVLLMVPGDLIVYLKIAVQICLSQKPDHLVEILVIPDQMSLTFRQEFNAIKARWPSAPLRLLPPNPFEQALVKALNNPHLNNWLQLVRGCGNARSTHVLWHDADLFIKDENFFKEHYEKCVQNSLACLGVSEVWDDWYRENGYKHLAATWEIMMDLSWVKSFKPWQHRGHRGTVKGKEHVFDITLLPQCLTAPKRISHELLKKTFIHFNYTISTYRLFQNSRGRFVDKGFKLLLTRLLADTYDAQGVYEIPSFDELALGLRDMSLPVVYHGEELKQEYSWFRSKFGCLLDSGLIPDEHRRDLVKKVGIFDDHFEGFKWVSSSAS